MCQCTAHVQEGCMCECTFVWAGDGGGGVVCALVGGYGLEW